MIEDSGIFESSWGTAYRGKSANRRGASRTRAIESRSRTERERGDLPAILVYLLYTLVFAGLLTLIWYKNFYNQPAADQEKQEYSDYTESYY